MCCTQAVYRQLNSRILYASMAGVWDNKNRRAHGEGFIVGGRFLSKRRILSCSMRWIVFWMLEGGVERVMGVWAVWKMRFETRAPRM